VKRDARMCAGEVSLAIMKTEKRVTLLCAMVRAIFLSAIGTGLCLALVACGSKEAAKKLDPDMARVVAEKKAFAR